MQTISFCLYSLSRHPEIQVIRLINIRHICWRIYREENIKVNSRSTAFQDRCVEEIRTHLGNKNDNFTYQQYKSLKYLENVIKETLRIYTAVPLIARKVEEDIVLPSMFF